MKNKVLLLSLPLLVTSVAVYEVAQKPVVEQPNRIVLCGSSTDDRISPMGDGKYIGPLPGWGNYSYTISTRNDSAQFYFDQGLTLYYSYHMREAMASFKEAARLDPTCAMAWWGQALAGGPYYNAAHLYKMPPEIPSILARMNELAPAATPKEKQLIEAMNARYSSELTDVDRQKLNQAYAAATRKLLTAFDEPDVKMLYVDAIMLIHAWDFWNQDGSPKAWTQEVVGLSEQVLSQFPNHPAALHYYIHLTEASHHPEVALANAQKLEVQFPGVAHMVHMASHEYQRNGLFWQGVLVNDKADDNLLHYDSLASHLGLLKHSPHYFAVQTYCALTGGMYQTGLNDALRCRRSVSPVADNAYDQYLYMLPSLTLVRLGKWDELLASEKPNTAWPYASLLDHFARGMALVRTGKTAQAHQELQRLRHRLQEPILEKRRIPFNAPLQIAHIANYILEATLLVAEKKQEQAIVQLQKAVAISDQLIYTEPNDWPLPPRQYLGASLLAMHKASQAEAVYREDLIHNPGNGWSMVGLYTALKQQGKTADLPRLAIKYNAAFSKAERVPVGSVY